MRRQALGRVDLTIEPGSILALLGPSGSGKTTLLRILAGLEVPDEGRVFFDERDVTGFKPEQRDVGFVFQRPALYPHLRVAQNIAYGMRVRGDAPDVRARRVSELARALRIEPLLERRPRELSGGEQQRVALARGLATGPKLLALDEPFSNLDAPLRDELRPELARVLRAFGATAILVTHDPVDALSLGDAVAIIEGGVVHHQGTPRELYERPRTAFAARFAGSPAMNFVRGSVRGGAFAAEGFPPGALFDTGAARALAAGLAEGDAFEIGVRPEDVCFGAQNDVTLTGTVAGIDDRGAARYAVLSIASLNIACLLPQGAEAPARGTVGRAAFAVSRTHVFDGVRGERIERSVRV